MVGARIVGCACALLAGGVALAQLNDGDMDALAVGTPPDCDVPAGAWQFPANYIAAGLCELTPDTFEIVETNQFDPDAKGNSLRLAGSFTAANNLHLTNIMDSKIETGTLVTVDFDIWVAEGGGGGSVYVGGDHGGGGFSNATDRGPQLTWLADGTIVWTNGVGANTVATEYKFNIWQHVRLVIDMETDTFDMFWSVADDPLSQVGDNLGFRAAGGLSHIDRFSYVVFGATVPTLKAFIDNVSVEAEDAGCYADCNGDGSVNIFDFLCFQGKVTTGDPAADCNGDGNVNIFDFLCFQGAVTLGC